MSEIKKALAILETVQCASRNNPNFTIVICGNPVDGFFFYGPFACAADAVEWADAEGQEYHIARLASPTVPRLPAQSCTVARR